MTAEQISSKVRQILQDYRRRNDYTLEDAQRDMANLMGVHAAQQKSEIAQRCPVCGGNGLVANGFYNQTSGYWLTSSIVPETCRTCNGSGVYVQKSEIKMPTEEEIEEAAYSYACCAPIVGQSRMGFRAGIEWLRNQIG